MVKTVGSHVFAVFARALGLTEVRKVNTKSLQKVWEGPCWERMWPFLDPWDVNIASKNGPHGELFFLSIKKEPIVPREMVDFGHDAPLEAQEYEEHNVGDLSLEVVGQGWSGWLVHLSQEDWELARVAVGCHLALDLLCQEMQVSW